MKTSDNESALLRVGPSRYSPGGFVEFREYPSGEIAMEVIDEIGEPQYVATVALARSGAPHPGFYGVWLKGWDENEGVPEAFEQAGIVTLTGRKYNTAFVEAQHAELTERARTALVGQQRS